MASVNWLYRNNKCWALWHHRTLFLVYWDLDLIFGISFKHFDKYYYIILISGWLNYIIFGKVVLFKNACANAKSIFVRMNKCYLIDRQVDRSTGRRAFDTPRAIFQIYLNSDSARGSDWSTGRQIDKVDIIDTVDMLINPYPTPKTLIPYTQTLTLKPSP